MTLPNFRDLGGLPLTGSGTTPAGVLMRSAVPVAEDPEPDGVRWGSLLVLDLRSASETAVRPHALAAYGAEVHTLPMSHALDPTRRAPEDFAATYLEAVENDQERYVAAVELIGRSDRPVLVHCAAGKDRTGLLVALLLALIGVPDDAIVADFMKSGENVEEILGRVRLLRAGDDPWEAYGLGGAYDMPGHAVRAVLDRWASHPGGAEGWLLDAGATPEAIAGVRRRLTSA